MSKKCFICEKEIPDMTEMSVKVCDECHKYLVNNGQLRYSDYKRYKKLTGFDCMKIA